MTEQITVSVTTEYLDYQSSKDESRFVFAYHITISNLGTQEVQLLNRHWIITDANNQVREVKGEGVIGEQPIMAPGESFSYTSGVMIETEVGTMEGHYQMINQDKQLFNADIPLFRLSVPGIIN